MSLSRARQASAAEELEELVEALRRLERLRMQLAVTPKTLRPTPKTRRRTAKDPLPQHVAADRAAGTAHHKTLAMRELNPSNIKVHPPQEGVHRRGEGERSRSRRGWAAGGE